MEKKTSQRINDKGRAVMSGIAKRKQGKEAFGSPSDEKYRQMFEGLPQGAFFQAADGGFIDVNRKALQILGLTRREFLKRTSRSPSWDVIREDGSKAPAEEHPSMAALKTGIPVRDKILGVFNHRIEAYVWVIINAIPQLRPGKRTPYQVFVTMHDITDRRLADEVLRHCGERYCALIETSHDAIITANGQRHIVLWNRGAEKLYGYTAEEIIGQDCFLLMPESSRDRHAEIITLLIKAGKPLTSAVPIEGPSRRRDGSVFDVEQIFNLCWINNEPFFTIFVRDITERKQFQKKLSESEELLRLNFENAPVGVIFLDKDGMLIQANKFCEQCFGRSRKVLLQQGLDSFLHPDDRLNSIQAFAADHERLRRVTVVENRYYADDGRTIYTKQHIHGVFDEAGMLVCIHMLTEEITATKQLTLMNYAIMNKLKDIYNQLNEFCDMLPADQNFLTSKSMIDYGLTPTENRIASMIFHGALNTGIARTLCISENTVKHHITSIYDKLKVKNRLGFINVIRTNRIVI